MMILKDRKTLLPDYIPATWPCRDDAITYINKHVMHPETPTLFYGPPGAGKTGTFRYCTKNRANSLDDLRIAHLHSTSAPHTDVLTIIEQMGYKTSGNKRSTLFLWDLLAGEFAENDLKGLVIIDDADIMLGMPNGIELLSRMIDTNNISVALVSNRKIRIKNADLRDRLGIGSAREFHFKPYTTDEIKTILKLRAEVALREDVITTEALNFIATHVEPTDMHYALCLLKFAADEATADMQLGITEEVVMQSAVKEARCFVHDSVAPLPHGQLLTLAAACECPNGSQPVTSAAVIEQYGQVCRRLGVRPCTHRAIQGYLSGLADRGLINYRALSRNVDHKRGVVWSVEPTMSKDTMLEAVWSTLGL